MKKGIAVIISLFTLLITLPLQACQPASGNNYEVLSLDVAPGKVIVNEKFSVIADVNNGSGSQATYTVPVMINGIADERQTVTIGPGKSQEIQFTFSKSKPGIYEIAVGNKKASITVEESAPAAFKLSGFNIGTLESTPGEEVFVTTVISNTGGSKGAYIAELSVNGTVEQSERVVIPEGVNYNCVFRLVKNDPGTYTVSIGDLTGKFTVVKPVQTIQVTVPTSPAVQERVSRWPKSSESCGAGGCGPGGCP